MRKSTFFFLICLLGISINAFSQSITGPAAQEGQIQTYTFNDYSGSNSVFHLWVLPSSSTGTFSNGCQTKLMGSLYGGSSVDITWTDRRCGLFLQSDILVFVTNRRPNAPCSWNYYVPNYILVEHNNFGELGDRECTPCSNFQQQIDNYANGSLDPPGIPAEYVESYRCSSIETIIYAAAQENPDCNLDDRGACHSERCREFQQMIDDTANGLQDPPNLPQNLVEHFRCTSIQTIIEAAIIEGEDCNLYDRGYNNCD